LDAEFFSSTGVVVDGIPALTQPEFLPGDHPDLQQFLKPDDRVMGYVVNGTAYAVPHRILWFHEIANVTVPGPEGAVDLAVTYCPLTGSSMVFDRAPVGGAEFGVSGLLYKSNLIMYDRQSEVSLWPQMLAESRCGPETGTRLPLYPSIEMTWAGWLSLHPDTHVLGEIGLGGGYDRYPYGNYETRESFGFPMPPPDLRIHPKERVLGLRAPEGEAIAFPFGFLANKGEWVTIPQTVGWDRIPAVVFWDRSRQSAAAYRTQVGEEELTFQVTEMGIEDLETGSLWTVDGHAASGPFAGSHLEPAGEAFVAFWGAWQAFYPETDLWGPWRPPPPSGESAPGR
jgi:hypothetical protein